MIESHISIGQVKREISELLNRVAYGGERIVLTSRGKPKAVIISLDDYERIQNSDSDDQINRWEAWKAKNAKLTAEILEERGGKSIDVDKIWEESRKDLEKRHDYLLND